MAVPLVVPSFNGDVVGYSSWKVSVTMLQKLYKDRVSTEEFAYTVSRALVGDAERWLNAQPGESRFNLEQLLNAMDAKFGPEASARDVITRLMQARVNGRSKEEMRAYVESVNGSVAALSAKSFKNAAHTLILLTVRRKQILN